VFRSSGTTDRVTRARHLVPHLDLYRTAALAAFARFILPDRARLAALFLVPSPALRPDSSLIRMCGWVGEVLAARADWFVGSAGLEVERLLARLVAAEDAGEPVLLAGVTAAFAELFEACRARGRSFRLAPPSR